MENKPERSLPQSLPPRGLSREQAAAYVGISPSLFDTLVKDGRMPAPKRINSRTVWDRFLLDEAFTALPSNDAVVNPWDEITSGRLGDHANSVQVHRRGSRPAQQYPRLRARVGTDKFLAAYNAAISEHVSAPRQARAVKTGSFRHVCVLYYASATFKRLDPATQAWRRRALDSVCEKHADKAVALMEARHVRALRDERSDANTRLKA